MIILTKPALNSVCLQLAHGRSLYQGQACLFQSLCNIHKILLNYRLATELSFAENHAWRITKTACSKLPRCYFANAGFH